MNSFVWKDWKRTQILTWKKYDKLALATMFVSWSILSFIGSSDIQISVQILYLILISLCLFLIFQDHPPLKFNPTYLLTCFNTDRLYRLLHQKYLFSILKALGWSISIWGLSFNSAMIDGIGPIQFFNVLLFILISQILGWVRFNKHRVTIKVFFIYIISSIALISANMMGLAINLALFILGVMWLSQLKINMDKLLWYSNINYKIDQANLRDDYSEMLNLTLLFRKSSNYKLKLRKVLRPASQIMISKDIVQLVRQPKVMYVISTVVIVASIVLEHYQFLVGVLLQSLFIYMIVVQSTQSISSVLTKQQEGLLLPFSNRQICVNSSIVPIICSSLYVLLLALIAQVSLLRYFVTIFLISVIALAISITYLKRPSFNSGMTLLSISSYLLILLFIFY